MTARTAFHVDNAGVIFVLGEKRLAFLNNLVTNQVSDTSVVAAFLTRLGKIIALVTILPLGNAHAIAVEYDRLQPLLDYLQKLAKLMKVTVFDKSSEFLVLSVFGHGEREIYPTSQPLPALKQLDDVAYEAYRIGHGIPRWGTEMTEATTFPDLGLDLAVSYTKGCYVGQEIVARVKHLGQPPRLLRLLVIDGGRVPVHGDSIYVGELQVGTITSAARSTRQMKVVALGFVQKGYNALGQHVTVAGQQGIVTVPSFL